MSPDWQKLFPAADFRLPMALRPGSAPAFWSPWDVTGKLLAERRRWLAKSPELFAASLRDVEPGKSEALAWMRSLESEPEPDWVLLSSDVEREPVVLAGEVVFPSMWSLPEKLGRPLSSVHAPVPGLQKALGASIQSFLARIESGAEWQRENWGMSAHQELNNHPARSLPGLTANARLETTWIRLESQFLTRLPQSRCLLFGIRVSHHRLDEVATLPDIGERIARALRTMPDAVAHYKGLALARDSLARLAVQTA